MYGRFFNTLYHMLTETHEKLRQAYQTSRNYPELVSKFIAIGIESYTADVATGMILYRLPGGEYLFHPAEGKIREINPEFSEEYTVLAIRNNQAGKTTYPEFMNEIADAGVRMYEATLLGRKRVTYFGSGGKYEELIPI